MEKHSLWKTLRICAGIARFLTNYKKEKTKRKKGPLTSQELELQKTWRTKTVQTEVKETRTLQTDKIQLSLQANNEGIMECRGRTVGVYTVYLPDDHLFTAKFVQRAHLTTLHGGVILAMAIIRETHWIPRLRSLVKKV